MKLYSGRLRAKISFLTSIIIIFLTGIFLLFEYNYYKTKMGEHFFYHMKESASSLRSAVDNIEDIALVQDILEDFYMHLKEEGDFEHRASRFDRSKYEGHEIHLVDLQGIITASTHPELVGKSIDEATGNEEKGIFDILEGQKTVDIRTMSHRGVKVIDASVPLYGDRNDRSKVTGAMHYVDPYTAYEDVLREGLLYYSIFGFTLAGVLALLVNLVLQKVVISPLRKLTNAMKNVEENKFDVEINLSSRDEIGDLAGSFNQMAIRLKESYSDLERRVDERTRELSESKRQLIQSAKLASIGELAACVAHEIRNPLAGISASSQILKRKCQREEDQTELINMILLEIESLEEVVTNFLNFASPTRSELKNCDINDLLEETIHMVMKQFSDQNVKVNKGYDKHRPVVVVDEKQIKNVFLNIFINALQAMPNGGNLVVTTKKSEDKVLVEIEDTGVGIARENINKIFEPFSSTKHQGTGLGLSIAQRIIEEHGGSISAESEEGSGATFTIEIPLNEKLKLVDAEVI